MADNTNNYGLPYPQGDDAVVVATDIERLAKRADAIIPPAIDERVRPVAGEVQDHARRLTTVRRGVDDSYRIMDKTGAVAFEVDPEGRTHIYSPADGTGILGITTLHVFVAAGQSNMSGRGRPVEGPTSSRIMQFGANRRVIEQAPLQLDMVDSPAGTSPATFFAHHYLATQPSNVGVLLIPAARGGTTFNGSPSNPSDIWTWVKGAAIDPEHALYDRSVQQTLDAIDAAKAASYQVILKGVLWHQGEGNSSTDPAQYTTWLDDLIANYRADLNAPRLPVMIGQMCPEGIDRSSTRQQIDQVHQHTPHRVDYTGFAPATYDAHLPNDTTHFNTKGTSYLGDTYLTAYTQALGNSVTLAQSTPRLVSPGVYEIGV